MNQRTAVLVFLSLSFLSETGWSFAISPYDAASHTDIPSFLDRAAIVCKGKVIHLLHEGEGSHQVGGRLEVKNQVRATVQVDRFYKGQANREITIVFRENPPPQCSFCFAEGDFVLFFLQAAGRDFALVDMYYRKLEAPPQLASPSPDVTNPLKLLELDLKTALHSTNREDVLLAVALLGSMKKIDSTKEMKDLIPTGDRELAGLIYLSLLRLGDNSALREAGMFVDSKADDYLIERLQSDIRSAIDCVKDESSVPVLIEFAGSQNVRLRVAALQALRKTKSPKSVPVLVERLDDPDQQVRYLAVMGLATIEGRLNPEWATAVDRFKQNEQKYLSKWKTWWSEEGSKKYAGKKTLNNP